MPMQRRTHKTAVVLIPPEEVWEPIQAIRREHDRQIRRWMPHMTLVYPFRPAAVFAELVPALADALHGIGPFAVRLAEFRTFAHRRNSFTVWLSPEPAAPVCELQEWIQGVVPDCDAVRRHAHGFTPHLSVGQVRSRPQLEELMASFAEGWEPVSFTVRSISLISRGDPPDDVFQVAHTITLGRA